MGRTPGAKDKAPRQRQYPLPGDVVDGEVITKPAVKFGPRLSKMVDIVPSDNELLLDGANPRAVTVTADRPGIYSVDMEVNVHGDWVRVKQPFAVVLQTHDVLGTRFEEPFLTSPVFPLHVRRIYEKGTNAKTVSVFY